MDKTKTLGVSRLLPLFFILSSPTWLPPGPPYSLSLSLHSLPLSSFSLSLHLTRYSFLSHHSLSLSLAGGQDQPSGPEKSDSRNPSEERSTKMKMKIQGHSQDASFSIQWRAGGVQRTGHAHTGLLQAERRKRRQADEREESRHHRVQKVGHRPGCGVCRSQSRYENGRRRKFSLLYCDDLLAEASDEKGL